MKRFLLALAVTGISANAWAATIECNKVDVASACKGYDKKPNDCLGVPTLVCPFDTEKVFCAHKHCEVGDVLYADGRCYGDLPVPKKLGDTHVLDPIGVVVDPATRLAVLAPAYRTMEKWQSYGYYSGTNTPYTPYMYNPDACLNSDEDYWPTFPAPTDTTVDACGIPSGTSTSFNWDISPLLQKIISPLRNFTPIKSAHAAYTSIKGCAIPYVATTQTGCTTISGLNVGGRFYTEQLMNFQSANSGTLFTVKPLSSSGVTVDVQGITFPAANYCYNLDIYVDNGEQLTPIRPFLPSVGDLYKMLKSENAIAILNGFVKADISGNCSDIDKFENANDLHDFLDNYNGECTLYAVIHNLFNTTRGVWSSQQSASRYSNPNRTYWNGAVKVGANLSLSGETWNINPIIRTTLYGDSYSVRSQSDFVFCFINYSPRSDDPSETLGDTLPDNDTPSAMVSGVTGNQGTVAP